MPETSVDKYRNFPNTKKEVRAPWQAAIMQMPPAQIGAHERQSKSNFRRTISL
jgi:hypothetical protein